MKSDDRNAKVKGVGMIKTEIDPWTGEPMKTEDGKIIQTYDEGDFKKWSTKEWQPQTEVGFVPPKAPRKKIKPTYANKFNRNKRS